MIRQMIYKVTTVILWLIKFVVIAATLKALLNIILESDVFLRS
jgi:hypothetical protein